MTGRWSWAGSSNGPGRLRMAVPDPLSRSWPRSWGPACAGRRQRRPRGRGARASRQLDQRGDERDAGAGAAFAEILARFRRRAMLVVLTELAEQAVSETLLPALPLIARDHLVVVASVADPEVRGWALATPVEPETAYRKAAAVAALADGAGPWPACAASARWSSTRPRPPGPDLADAYLRVKATGRL